MMKMRVTVMVMIRETRERQTPSAVYDALTPPMSPFYQKRMDDSYLFYKASGELAVLTRQFCECNFVSVKRTSIKKLKSHKR